MQIFAPVPGVGVWGILAFIGIANVAISVPTNVVLYGIELIPALILAVLASGSLLLAVRMPKTALGISLLPVALIPFLGMAADVRWPWPWPVTALIVQSLIIFVIALRNPWPVALTAWAASVAASILPTPWRFAELDSATISIVIFASIAAFMSVLAVLIVQRETVRAQLVREKQISAAELTRRELVEERNRIARELHDVVAHGMSVIHVQATTAQYRIAGMDEATIAEFAEIAASARSSIAEMRRLLGVLRDEETTTEFAPQPGLDGVPALVASAERAGIPVTLTISDAAANCTVPQTIGLAVYRIVQEAMSNVIRHAPGAPTTVLIDREAGDLTVDVKNAPSPEPAPPFAHRVPLGTSDTGGHGLIGIRERVALLGGRTSLGPLDDGGYRVEARLPFDVDGSARRPEPSGQNHPEGNP